MKTAIATSLRARSKAAKPEEERSEQEKNLIPLNEILTNINGYSHRTLLNSQVIISRLEEISPIIAKRYLTLMTPRAEGQEANRKLNSNRVNEYAEQIINGNYRMIHQGIAFDSEGRLIDGQHRLHAIIKANRPVVMMVTYGIHPDASVNIDQNRPRTAADNLHINGKKNSNHRIAITMRIACGIKRDKGPYKLAEPKLLLHDEHEEAIEFVLQHSAKKNRGVGSAAVLSVFARAYYTQDHEKIKAFMSILNTGVAPEGCEIDHSILAQIIGLRDYLTSYNSGRGKGHNDMVMEYAKTQMILWAFLNNHTGKLKLLTDKTVFPIPSDEHFPEVLGYGSNSKYVPSDENGDGLWDTEHTNKREIGIFAALWHETYGETKVYSTDLVSMALANNLFGYLEEYPSDRVRACMFSKAVLVPLFGVERGTKEFYWLRSRTKKTYWRIIAR